MYQVDYNTCQVIVSAYHVSHRDNRLSSVIRTPVLWAWQPATCIENQVVFDDVRCVAVCN